MSLICAVFAPAAAAAAPEVHGAVDASGLFNTQGRYGGLLSLDVGLGSGIVRGGVSAGVGALSAGDTVRSSHVFTPVGLFLSLGPASGDSSGLFGVARFGAAPGAEKGGLSVFAWAGCAAGYRFALGEGASLRLGANGLWLLGQTGGLIYGPFLGLGF